MVDDGSKDDTFRVMQKYEDLPRVKAISKPNGGKASALNLGYQNSRGEILFFVDADGIFNSNTIEEMLKAFTSEKVGAVCGNDAPVNLENLLTRLESIQTHVGTGFVRRALAELNCLPIVSGNVGAFRRTVLEKTFSSEGAALHEDITRLWQNRSKGPFLEGFIGEDLELTWRVHRAGYQVKFSPRAVVNAEVPSTINGLWKQRVRWARGLLQTIRIHKKMFFNPHIGLIGFYLPINFVNMIVIPILQLISVLLIIALWISGYHPIDTHIVSLILWTGVTGALFTTIFAIALDNSWRDLKYFYVLPLWVPYSLLMDLVMVWAIILEIRGVEAQWNKLDRTGVVSRRSAVEEQKGK
jgi:cellulose synthase/poly-beta-1,6-N-acetylglucosamine synthase-like glycosyltransferase